MSSSSSRTLVFRGLSVQAVQIHQFSALLQVLRCPKALCNHVKITSQDFKQFPKLPKCRLLGHSFSHPVVQNLQFLEATPQHKFLGSFLAHSLQREGALQQLMMDLSLLSVLNGHQLLHQLLLMMNVDLLKPTNEWYGIHLKNIWRQVLICSWTPANHWCKKNHSFGEAPLTEGTQLKFFDFSFSTAVAFRYTVQH